MKKEGKRYGNIWRQLIPGRNRPIEKKKFTNIDVTDRLAKNKNHPLKTFDGNRLESMFFKFGTNFSLNLRYNIQAVGGIGGNLFLYAEDKTGKLI